MLTNRSLIDLYSYQLMFKKEDQHSIKNQVKNGIENPINFHKQLKKQRKQQDLKTYG